mgnify:CR=1 FL=1
MLKTFIERPVLSTVISIIIVVLGIIGLVTLPVEQYPDIAPPTVVVNTTYSGANADVVMNSVIVPIEEQVNGVEGMTYMTSSASNDGQATVTVYFKQGINPDIAAVNVQNRVTTVLDELPEEVIKAGVTTEKEVIGLYKEAAVGLRLTSILLAGLIEVKPGESPVKLKIIIITIIIII